jgi:enamine deaminase RidA (YjgF/YER057c/UK114 family)
MDDLAPHDRLAALGLALPPAPKPAGVYKPCLIDGHHVYVSGHGPLQNDGTLITGRVGRELDSDAGKAAARQVGLAILATLVGMVNCTPEFERHPYVINGCSELFSEIWGHDHGVGVRSAVGMGSLPDNISVEIEAIFELHPEA